MINSNSSSLATKHGSSARNKLVYSARNKLVYSARNKLVYSARNKLVYSISQALSQERTIIIMLILAVLFKGMLWMIATPIWHGPDEAAHFAKVQLYGENLNPKNFNNKDHSLELLLSERLLGTERNSQGNNKFTYHPEYRISYSNDNTGVYENEIKNFPSSYRTDLVKKESASYPFFYYAVGGIFYKLFYGYDLFVRVFAVRSFSLLTLLITAFLAYKTGLLIFLNRSTALSLAILVSFQPMMTFTSSSVNSDNLGNVLFTFIIYLLVKIINKGISLSTIVLLPLALGIGLLTKPQTIFFFFLSPTILLFLKKRDALKVTIFLLFCLLIALKISAGDTLFKIQRNWELYRIPLPYIELSPAVNDISFISFLKFTLNHTIAEVIPWYWGVFNWLGVVLPRVVNRVLMRIVLVGGLGFILYLLKVLIKKEWNPRNKSILFLGLIAIAFFAVVTVWDFSHTRSIGFSIGIQGRYFLPTVMPHMVILMVGIETVISFATQAFSKIFKKHNLTYDRNQLITFKLSAISMILLNFIALNTLINSYYDTSNIKTFISQISQYKPEVFKGPAFIVFLFLYSISTLMLIKLLFGRNINKNNNES